jgi:hypothetical protein
MVHTSKIPAVYVMAMAVHVKTDIAVVALLIALVYVMDPLLLIHAIYALAMVLPVQPVDFVRTVLLTVAASVMVLLLKIFVACVGVMVRPVLQIFLAAVYHHVIL